MKAIRNLLLGLGVALLPIYLVSSGGAQISHVLLALAAVMVVARHGLRLSQVELCAAALLCVIIARDALYTLSSASAAGMLPSLYAAFSIFVFVAMRRWASSDEAWTPLIFGMYFAAAVAVAGVFYFGFGDAVDAEGGRSVGTFNNPNQLGYFSVCLLALAAACYLRRAIGLRGLAFVVVCSLFLSMSSLSKAAMLSCAFACLWIGFLVSRSRTSFFVGSLVCVLLVLGAWWAISAGTLDDFRFFERLKNIGGQSDDSVVGRGYDIFMHVDGATELLFGFNAERVSAILGHEIHSTVGSFFANYGLVGGGAFVVLLIQWMRHVYGYAGLKGVMIVVGPPMLYGLAHNGSRFTIFWLLMAVSSASVGVIVARQSPRGTAIRNDFASRGLIRG